VTCPLAPLLLAHTLIHVMPDSDSPHKQSPCLATDLTTHLVCTAGMTPMAAHPGVRSASGGPCCSRSTTRTPRRLRRPWVSHLPERKRKETKRKDYAFWHQLCEKPSIIPGCLPASICSTVPLTDLQQSPSKHQSLYAIMHTSFHVDLLNSHILPVRIQSGVIHAAP